MAHHSETPHYPILKKAEAAFIKQGITAALACLRAPRMVHTSTKVLLTDAELTSLLGQFILPRDPQRALALARQAAELDKTCLDAWRLAGAAQDKLGNKKAARDAFMKVIRSPAVRPEQVLQAANMLVRHGEPALALKAATDAFNALGKPLDRVTPLLYIAQKTADWPLVEQLTGQLRDAYTQGRFDEAFETLRTHLNWCADPAWNERVIRLWNQRTFMPVLGARPVSEPLEGRRLRVGYLSSDFREHPTARLINGALRHHDRSRIELFLYCSGWDDGSAMRKEVESHVEHVHSVARLSDAEAAALIRSHQIDVLVELNGPTRSNRMGILAHQPAPVQIDYLGWPGSVGGRVVDAIVADAYVAPAEHEAFYPEKLIRLSPTYQINDYAAQAKPVPPTRQEAQLPDGDWLILGMFNGIEKVHKEVWAVWMEILRQVPKALLWMLDPGEVARQHIVEATRAHGIDPRRLLIAPRLRQDAHLARLALCDLMLDPWPYGGHTTTSDALFTGVPVIALEGTNFASRVSGSLLHAAGLGQLVTADIDAYVALAVKLLRSPPMLAQVRGFIAERVMRAGIFDAASATRQLEAAYFDMAHARLSGAYDDANKNQNVSRVPDASTASLRSTPALPVAETKTNTSAIATQPADEEDEAAEERIRLILVCGPWGSGTSAVAGMLAKAGLVAPAPYVRTNDPRTEVTYETKAFQQLLQRLASEQQLRRLVSRDDALLQLKNFRDTVLKPALATSAAGTPLMLKHGLAAFFLDELSELFDVEVVVVLRPVDAIEKTRQRRQWPSWFGRAGAERIYRSLFDYLPNTELPYYLLRYSALLSNPAAELDRLLAHIGFTPSPAQREAALAFVNRPSAAGATAGTDAVPADQSQPGPAKNEPVIFRPLNKVRPKSSGAVVFSIIRDERYLMPHFLAHYRQLGVKSFVFLDDSSVDGTREFLQGQRDCTVLVANRGFAEMTDGVTFHVFVKQTLPKKMLMGRWVLTVDADEFLLLPPSFTQLDVYCAHLDKHGLNHSRALMLDFFPARLTDIDDAQTEINPFQWCPFFDVIRYDWPDGASHPASLSYSESLRPRLLQHLIDEDPGLREQFSAYRSAALNKVPLLKWGDGAQATKTHRVSIPVSNRSQMVLAHFKLIPGWEKAARSHVERQNHWNASIEYRLLVKAAERLQQRDLAGPKTQRYIDRRQLAALGLVFAP